MFEAAEEGQLSPDDVRGLLIDYIAPSLDTTILATGHLLHLLGRHPEQYAHVRAHPERIAGAVHEALRFESPVRAFTRLAVSDYDAGGVSIPKGDRALILYGSANRDERHYPDPDRFDVTRDARDHVALGYGVHRCAGGYLAQLEMESLLLRDGGAGAVHRGRRARRPDEQPAARLRELQRRVSLRCPIFPLW